MTLVYFLLMISPLVFIHELGHFVAARFFGVRVLSFAVGVGPSVVRWKPGPTEYALRALPLGGYVLLRGMADDGDDADERRKPGEFSLLDVAPWKRMIISLAGPVFSVMTALPIFFGIDAADAMRYDAVVGYVAAGSPAADAGLHPGDRVLRADGDTIECFDDLREVIRRSPGEQIELVVDRMGETVTLQATPDSVERLDSITRLRRTTRGELGFGVHQQRARVAVDSGTSDVPLRTHDQVVSVDGRPVRTWLEFEAELRRPRETPMVLEVERPRPVPTRVGSLYQVDELTLEWSADSVAANGDALRPSHSIVYFVEPGSPAAVAGIRDGDELLTVDGRAIFDVSTAVDFLSSHPAEEVDVVIRRAGEELTLQIALVEVQVTEGGGTFPRVFVGMHDLPYGYVFPEMIEVGWSRRLSDAAYGAVSDTLGAAGMIVEIVANIFAGKSDSSNIGGPMMIADIAGQAAEAGWLVFLRFAGLISINLGIMNLIPLPGLDGGSIMIAFWETVTRRPLSTRARMVISYAGLACLVFIMLFVFKNDLQRYWVDIADWING